MRRPGWLTCLLVLAAAPRLPADEGTGPPMDAGPAPVALHPVLDALYPAPITAAATDGELAETTAWQTAWGVLDLRAIPAGVRVAPNGERYHPNFSLDLNFNIWLSRSHGLYLFGDTSLWGDSGQDGGTNARDGFLGTSKREFDLSGGVAWNYAGAWELRAFGYTQNNLNRGDSLNLPAGFQDGFGMENRYYLGPEYAKLGQTGFDVTQATFVSVGYYPSKDMVGNDGVSFQPGLLLRAYLTYGLGNWPCYVFGDFSYISERDLRPRLFLFDVGLAVRPFSSCRQCEFRIGAEDTADLRVRDDLNLWYVSVRYVY